MQTLIKNEKTVEKKMKHSKTSTRPPPIWSNLGWRMGLMQIDPIVQGDTIPYVNGKIARKSENNRDEPSSHFSPFFSRCTTLYTCSIIDFSNHHYIVEVKEKSQMNLNLHPNMEAYKKIHNMEPVFLVYFFTNLYYELTCNSNS